MLKTLILVAGGTADGGLRCCFSGRNGSKDCTRQRETKVVF